MKSKQWLIVVMMLSLCLFGCGQKPDELPYFQVSAVVGNASTDGSYYYWILPENGDMQALEQVGWYRYEPGTEPEKVLPYWNKTAGYKLYYPVEANENGIYYLLYDYYFGEKEELQSAQSLYRKGKFLGISRLLYQIDQSQYDEIADFRLIENGNVQLLLVDSSSRYYMVEINGKNGKELTEPVTMAQADFYGVESDTVKQVGKILYTYDASKHRMIWEDTETGETWEYKIEKNCIIGGFDTDGTYLYTCGRESGVVKHMCWEVIYDGDRPTEIRFVEEIMDMYGNRLEQ